MLPTDGHCTLHFLQQVVRGRKRFLWVTDCRPIKVPIRPELSVARIWPDAIQIPGVTDYFPDEWEGASRVDRKFFWMILTSLHPEWVKHLIRGSREARNAHRANRVVERNLLQPNQDWVDNLLRAEGFVPMGKFLMVQNPKTPLK